MDRAARKRPDSAFCGLGIRTEVSTTEDGWVEWIVWDENEGNPLSEGRCMSMPYAKIAALASIEAELEMRIEGHRRALSAVVARLEAVKEEL